ncbi:MAG: hypothetical protein ABIJ33_03910 [Patescibacteria group bacterium]|nr:type II toxin-antitoxin system Phd/YefM family antitoxin [Patescibacteria group bacterium]
MVRQIDEEGGHYIVTRRNKPAFVAIPFADYQEIEDILLDKSVYLSDILTQNNYCYSHAGVCSKY